MGSQSLSAYSIKYTLSLEANCFLEKESHNQKLCKTNKEHGRGKQFFKGSTLDFLLELIYENILDEKLN